MDKETLEKKVREALDEYRLHEEAYGDDCYLAIDIDKDKVGLISGEEADVSPVDCYAVQELMKPDPANPAVWAIDTDQLRALLDVL